jgi:hypothetical protein
MRYFRIPTSSLNKASLLGLICLLLITTEITFAQSTPSISINDITVNERDSGLFGHEFTVSLSAASTQQVTVTASTQAGTASDNVDFGAGSVTFNIPAGQTSRTVTVFIIGDTVVEGTETFFVNLSNPVNATIADGQGVGTIVDDDGLFLLNQQGSQRGVALDSVFLTTETFPIVTDRVIFSTDGRMRIAVFAVGLKLAPAEPISAVTATAEDSVGTVRPLTVESVRTIPGFDWLTQVVVKLNDQITPAQDVKVRISLHGATSNAVNVAVKPQ